MLTRWIGPAIGLGLFFVSTSRAFAQEPPPEEPATPEPAHEPASPKTPAGTNEPLSTPPPPATPDDHARVDNSPMAHDGHPLAGYHNGLFFLRDHHDNFHLYIQGRAQLDWYSQFGSGVEDTGLKPTLFVRRVRPEVSGEFLGHWRFMIAGDFGATAVDNPRGLNESFAGPPGTAPSAGSARFATAETVRFSAQATDVFVNYRNGSLFNVQVGQMDAPFTMENRTSDKYIPFMERSLAVRAVGIPTNKEIGAMFWGETENRLFSYWLGPFMGEGQNRPNVDSRMDLFARTFVHPLATSDVDRTLKDVQVGASFHYGSRDKDWVDYDYSPMTTQGGFPFWLPSYAGQNGFTHVIPTGDQIAVAGELRVPIDRFDLTSEVVWISNNTREALDGYVATNSERFGRIDGLSYYVQAGFWPVGKRDVNGVPGYGNPPRLDFSKSDPVIPDEAVQLLVKWEQVALDYESASRSGTPDPRNIDGRIKVNAFSAGINYWATRHVRLTLNYVLDMFPDSAPFRPTAPGGPAQTSTNRALAPGNTLAPGINDSARDNAHSVHELLARIAIAL